MSDILYVHTARQKTLQLDKYDDERKPYTFGEFKHQLKRKFPEDVVGDIGGMLLTVCGQPVADDDTCETCGISVDELTAIRLIELQPVEGNVIYVTSGSERFELSSKNDAGNPYTFGELKRHLKEKFPDAVPDPSCMLFTFAGEIACHDDHTIPNQNDTDVSTLFARLSTIALIEVKPVEPEKADLHPNDTVQWMWGDAGRGGVVDAMCQLGVASSLLRAGAEAGHAVAARNPWRWSNWRWVGAISSHLATYKDLHANRPVEIRIKRTDAILGFDTLDKALLALREQENLWYQKC